MYLLKNILLIFFNVKILPIITFCTSCIMGKGEEKLYVWYRISEICYVGLKGKAFTLVDGCVCVRARAVPWYVNLTEY